jgi:hypothetical protein
VSRYVLNNIMLTLSLSVLLLISHC